MNVNKVIVIGRITQDLILKALPNGSSVLNFSVATNYVYKDNAGQKVEQTEFHNVVSFGRQAENISKFFVKGQEIYVEGRLQTRSWEDQNCNNAKRYRTEIILEKFEFGSRPGINTNNIDNSYPAENNFLNTNNQNNFSQKNNKVEEIEYPEDDIDPEDIPF